MINYEEDEMTMLLDFMRQQMRETYERSYERDCVQNKELPILNNYEPMSRRGEAR